MPPLLTCLNMSSLQLFSFLVRSLNFDYEFFGSKTMWLCKFMNWVVTDANNLRGRSINSQIFQCLSFLALWKTLFFSLLSSIYCLSPLFHFSIFSFSNLMFVSLLSLMRLSPISGYVGRNKKSFGFPLSRKSSSHTGWPDLVLLRLCWGSVVKDKLLLLFYKKKGPTRGISSRAFPCLTPLAPSPTPC